MSDFYCMVTCGDPDFSIDEWNKAFKFCIDAGLGEEETRKILDGEPCKVQCEKCACMVGEQQAKTRKLIEKMKSNAKGNPQ